MSKLNFFVLMILININLEAKAEATTTTATATQAPLIYPDPTLQEQYNEKKAAIEELTKAREALNKCQSDHKDKKDKCKTETVRVRLAKDRYKLAGGTVEKDQLESECDSAYETYKDDFLECKPSYELYSEKCDMNEDVGLMSSEMQNNLSPIAGLVSGADTLMDVYSAMNYKPGCQYSKSDFNDKEDSIKTQSDELEEKIKENIKEAQSIQKEYSDQLNSWSDEEQEILEQISAIPEQQKDALDEESRRKIDAKLKTESEFAANNLKITQLTVQYNAKIDTQKTKLKENSEFAIADKCLASIQPNATSINQTAQPLTITYRTVFSAAAVGLKEKKARENRYNQCADVYRSQVRELLNSIAAELNMIKVTINEIERQNGALQESLNRLNGEVAIMIDKIYQKYDKETKILRDRYQRLQAKREAERLRVISVLQTLNKENETLSKKVSILKLKIQSFVTGVKPQNTDKSVSKLIEECQDYGSFYDDFTNECCTGEYTGAGKRICKARASNKGGKDKKGAKAK